MSENKFVAKFVQFQKELMEKYSALDNSPPLEKADRLELFKLWISDEFDQRAMAHQERMLKLELKAAGKPDDEKDENNQDFLL